MTLAQIEQLPDETLTPVQVAAVLGIHPQSLRTQARECPETLGFPVVVVGSRVIIPRRAFLEFMSGKEVR